MSTNPGGTGSTYGFDNELGESVDHQSMKRNRAQQPYGSHGAANPKYLPPGEPTREAGPRDIEAGPRDSQSLRRFVRNTVTNHMGQRDAVCEGKIDQLKADQKVEIKKTIERRNSFSTASGAPKKKVKPLKCEIEGCTAKNAAVGENKSTLCAEHKAEDSNVRGRVSLKALGFKMDWKLAKLPAEHAKANAQLRGCASTLAVMNLLACGSTEAATKADKKIFGLIDDSRSISQTPYMLLDAAKYSSSKKCVPLMQMLIEYMGVKQPLLVVSITGADFDSTIDLKPKIKAILDNAVTEMKNVWFITTGVGAGVSAMIGRAVADYRKMMPGGSTGMMPVIGIIPWSEVPKAQRIKLGENDPTLGENDPTRTSPRRVEYNASSTAQWPDLDDCHTHYFFVRDGAEDSKPKTAAKRQADQLIDDVRAANRITKDFEDALKEEVQYMNQLRKWRRRYVNASGTHASFEVVQGTAGGSEKSTIVLTNTIFPSDYILDGAFEAAVPGDKSPPYEKKLPTMIIEWPGQPFKFSVTTVEFALSPVDHHKRRDSFTGFDSEEPIKEIVVNHFVEVIPKEGDSKKRERPKAGTQLRLVLGGKEKGDEDFGHYEKKEKDRNSKVFRSGSVSALGQTTESAFPADKRGGPAVSTLDLEAADTNEFDHFLEHTTKVGAVKLVISGGSECLEAAELAVRDIDSLCPLITFAGSGGFADVIALAWRLLHSHDALASQLQREQLDAMVRKVFDVINQQDAAAFIARIFNVCAVENKVLLFDVAGSDTQDLDKAVLDAIINVARPDFENLLAVDDDTELTEHTWNNPEEKAKLWTSNQGKANKSEIVQNYELHLNALRFAMEVDRIQEMTDQLDASRKAFEHMTKTYIGFLKAQTDPRRFDDYMEDGDDEGLLKFWWGETAEQRLILTFNEQVELALEWALDENKVEQVKLLKPLVEDFPMFVYGKKRCRANEGYGTTLSELYEYEKHRDVLEYLDPFLKVNSSKKDEKLNWNGLELHGKKEANGDTEPAKNDEKINNVRMRRVWSLVLQLLYDDDDKEAPLDESECKFEEKDEDKCKLRWGVDGEEAEGWKKCYGEAGDEYAIDVHYDRTLRSVYELVQKNTEKDGGVAGDLLANQELMIWAVLFNRFELAEYFWQEGGCAIPNALLASRLLYGLAERPELQKGSLSDVVEKMNAMSEHFEQAAIGVLTICYTENSDLAQDVLTAKLSNFDWMGFGVRGEKVKYNDSMELAYLANNMNFIAHPACQAVVDRKWKGGRAPDDKRSPDGKRISTAGRWQLFVNKMNSPLYKFRMDAMQYTALLLLQSYCVLQNLKVEKVSDMVVEHVLAVWYAALICEEIRSMFDDGWSKVFFWRWAKDSWNKLDCTMYILFIITYGMRLTFAREQSKYEPWSYRIAATAGVANPTLPNARRMNSLNSAHGVGGKGMYGLICLIMYMRAFQYLSNDEGLGPKILVLGKLVTSLMQYLVLLALFIVAFGIFMEGLANPSFSLDSNSNGGGLGYQDWSKTLHNVLYRPYFQMYGELMLEDISSETRCLGHTPFTGCSTGFEAIALPLAIAIYMIVTSLMILNMLIADFTLTFEASLETASRTFKMNKFDLLQQYDSKPPMPVPFSLPYVAIWRLYKNAPVMWSIVRNVCCSKCAPGTVRDTAWTAPAADTVEKNRKVEDFQDRCCDTYLLDVARGQRENVDARVARIEAEVTEARQALQFFKGKTFTNFAKREVAAITEKVKTAEFPKYTVSATLKALETETVCVLIPTVEIQASVDRRSAIQKQVAALEAVKSDVIIRGANEAGHWSPGSFEGQRCSFYQDVARDAETDLDKCKCRLGQDCVLENASCRYREKENGKKGFGKTAAAMNNPFGNPFLKREITEFRRISEETVGSFPLSVGENKMMLHIVTRWKRDEDGMTIDRGGRNLMEFVAFKRNREDDMWSIPAIPGGQVRTRGNSDSVQVDRIGFDSAVNQYAFTAKNFKDSVSETQKKFVQEQVDQLFYVPQKKDGRGNKQPNQKGIDAKEGTYPFNGKTIYEGFMDDERTTTAAWLTVKVVIHHDERNFLDAYSLNTSKATGVSYKAGARPDTRTEPPSEIAWLTLHRDLDLFGEEEDLLQHVAKVHGAYW